jgi:hypothetical protein
MSQGRRHFTDEFKDLPGRVARFRPDLLFVVHGRNFVRRCGNRFHIYRSAVWLLDEPYEVDDTTAYARHFDFVLVNDPVSLSRHGNGHYLLVCYDALVHFAHRSARLRTGFIGGGNPTRERLLIALAERGWLDYVVGARGATAGCRPYVWHRTVCRPHRRTLTGKPRSS